MNESDVLQLFVKTGVLVEGHFVYKSGKHGLIYVNKDAIYPHTAEISRLCCVIAERFIDDSVEVVIGPAIGGVVLSQWMAHHLSEMNGHEVFGIYAEKEGTEISSSIYGPLPPKHEDKFVIKRGYDEVVAGKRILVVEDILTTGGSAKKVVEITRAIGGNVVGLGALWNRGGITAQEIGVPKVVALVNEKLETWDENACLLCWRNIPINLDLGHGRAFLVAHAAAAAKGKA